MSTQENLNVLTIKEKWPNTIKHVPFVRIADDITIDDESNAEYNFLAILGGFGKRATKFIQYIGDNNDENKKNNKNTMILFKSDTKNNDLNKIGLDSGSYTISYLIKKDIGNYIIIINSLQGYSVYNIDNDTWIVKNNKAIKPKNNNGGFRTLFLSKLS